jgi:hypothetical protein
MSEFRDLFFEFVTSFDSDTWAAFFDYYSACATPEPEDANIGPHFFDLETKENKLISCLAKDYEQSGMRGKISKLVWAMSLIPGQPIDKLTQLRNILEHELERTKH